MFLTFLESAQPRGKCLLKPSGFAFKHGPPQCLLTFWRRDSLICIQTTGICDMPHSEPPPPEPPSKFIHATIVTTTKPSEAAARAPFFVRLPPTHRC